MTDDFKILRLLAKFRTQVQPATRILGHQFIQDQLIYVTTRYKEYIHNIFNQRLAYGCISIEVKTGKCQILCRKNIGTFYLTVSCKMKIIPSV